MNEEEQLNTYGGFKQDMGIKTHVLGPLDYAKMLKLRFRVEDRDPPKRRKRYTSSRVDKKEGAQSCPRGSAGENETHIVGERGLYKEERKVRGRNRLMRRGEVWYIRL